MANLILCFLLWTGIGFIAWYVYFCFEQYYKWDLPKPVLYLIAFLGGPVVWYVIWGKDEPRD